MYSHFSALEKLVVEEKSQTKPSDQPSKKIEEPPKMQAQPKEEPKQSSWGSWGSWVSVATTVVAQSVETLTETTSMIGKLHPQWKVPTIDNTNCSERVCGRHSGTF